MKQWENEYRSKVCTAAEAIGRIRSGQHIFVANNIGEPQALLAELVAQEDRLYDLTLHHMVTQSPGEYTRPEHAGHFRCDLIFCGAGTRGAVNEGRGDYTPCFFYEYPILIRRGVIPCEVALVQVAGPDEEGRFSLGTSVDYTYQAVKTAKLVIAQVNPRMPFTYGSLLELSDIDCLVEQEEELYENPSRSITEVERRIGQNCADFVEDGATVQLGIGGIPDAVAMALMGKKDLAIHSEMIADCTVALYEAGVITGKYKTTEPGKMAVSFLQGTRKLYDFADRNPDLLMLPVDYVNHPLVVMKQHKMVSINCAIEIDLQGQAASDSIGLRQYSGVGGQVDFIRGAAMSEDGKGVSILALPSLQQTRDGRRLSKIVPFLQEGAGVTTSRNDVDYVVTEYGAAAMKGQNLRKRARALIEIAHPDFRAALAEEFEKRFREPL